MKEALSTDAGSPPRCRCGDGVQAVRWTAWRLSRRCCFALGLVLLAQVLRWLVGLRWPVGQHFLFYHFAVVGAALMWGLVPGLVATAACALAAGFFHQPDPEGLVVFAASGAMTT